MGWWRNESDGSVIGDGPADALSIAIGDLSAAGELGFEALLRGLVAALVANPEMLVGDPASLSGALVSADFGGGRAVLVETGAPNGEAQVTRRLYDALERSAVLYREAYDRKPSVAELLETFAFAMRAHDDVAFPDGRQLKEVRLVAPSGPFEGESIVALGPQIRPEDVDRTRIVVGSFDRDPDRTDTRIPGSDRIEFASWTAHPGDDREIDYHYDPATGSAWLSVRGEGAGELARQLASALGAKVAPRLEAALAELMTPPPGPPQSPTGAMRWRTLCAVLPTAGPANRDLVHALVEAGLSDPDWRVRMTSVLAVGRLRFADLAERAMAAPVPKAGTGGLGQEDLRCLLALRHAARNLALGLGPEADLVGEAFVMPKRIAHQRKMRGLIEGEGATGVETEAALVAALLGEQGPPPPARWRGWLA